MEVNQNTFYNIYIYINLSTNKINQLKILEVLTEGRCNSTYGMCANKN